MKRVDPTAPGLTARERANAMTFGHAGAPRNEATTFEYVYGEVVATLDAHARDHAAAILAEVERLCPSGSCPAVVRAAIANLSHPACPALSSPEEERPA